LSQQDRASDRIRSRISIAQSLAQISRLRTCDSHIEPYRAANLRRSFISPSSQRAVNSRRSPIFASRPVAPCISHNHSRFASRSFLISTFLSSFTSLHASRFFNISFTFSTSFAVFRISFYPARHGSLQPLVFPLYLHFWHFDIAIASLIAPSSRPRLFSSSYLIIWTS
jgi:hypothetical protein